MTPRIKWEKSPRPGATEHESADLDTTSCIDADSDSGDSDAFSPHRPRDKANLVATSPRDRPGRDTSPRTRFRGDRSHGPDIGFILQATLSRLAAAAVLCVLVVGKTIAVSADVSTADLIPTPSDAAWVAFPDGTMALSAAEVVGQAGSEGFVDAYVKEWTQQARPFGLSDRLEHYSSISWARDRLDIYRHSAEKSKTKLTLTEVTFGGGAFEYSEPSTTQGRVVWTFVFTQEDYVSAIAVDTGAGGPDKGTMLDQARRQLGTIPYSKAEINAANHEIFSAMVVTIVAGALLLIVFAIVLILLVVVLRRRRSSPGAVRIPPRAPLSPDGRYWWDGVSWRPLPPS